MYICIFSIPFITSIVVLVFGRYFGIKGSIIIIISSIFITSIISIICYYEIIYSNSSISIYIKPFIKDDIIENNIVFIYDAISISFVITIVLISFNVYIFTIYYMSTDAHLVRFYIYMYLFTTSMIFLVITNSYISIFIGWEYIGVFSYYLINYWYKRIDANMAAIKAFMLNRVGDVCFTIIIVGLCIILGDTTFEITNSTIYMYNYTIIYYIGIFIIIASMAKSAQFGLHIWLPYSMEGLYI